MRKGSALYAGRDNALQWRLKCNGETIAKNAVTRVVVHVAPRSGGDTIRLDSEEHTDVRLLDDSTLVEIRFGQILGPGVYDVWLTVFDENHTNGIAWHNSVVIVREWPEAP